MPQFIPTDMTAETNTTKRKDESNRPRIVNAEDESVEDMPKGSGITETIESRSYPSKDTNPWRGN